MHRDTATRCDFPPRLLPRQLMQVTGSAVGRLHRRRPCRGWPWVEGGIGRNKAAVCCVGCGCGREVQRLQGVSSAEDFGRGWGWPWLQGHGREAASAERIGSEWDQPRARWRRLRDRAGEEAAQGRGERIKRGLQRERCRIASAPTQGRGGGHAGRRRRLPRKSPRRRQGKGATLMQKREDGKAPHGLSAMPKEMVQHPRKRNGSDI